MKKFYLLSTIILTAFCLSSCGFGSGSNLSSGNANLLGSVLANGNANAGSGTLSSVLTNLLGNVTSSSSIVGTWTYSAPKVVFESESVLAQIGSSVASSSIEKQLKNQLTKMGFKQGVSTMEFKEDGTCILALNGKNMEGTYTYDNTKHVMTVRGTFGVTTITPTVTVVGNEMFMLFEADKLLSVASAVAGNVASNLPGLLSNYNGLKLGWVMTK